MSLDYGHPEDFDSLRSTVGQRRAASYEMKVVMKALGKVRDGLLLDVGTGFGRLVGFTSPPEVVGVNVSEKELRGGILRYLGDDSKHFLMASATNLPFREESFDVAICIRTLRAVEDPDLAVSEVVEVLKPGGRLVVGMPNKYSPAGMMRRLQSWLGLRPPSCAYFSYSGGLKMLSVAGLMPYATFPLYKVDQNIWERTRGERTAGLVELIEAVLDKALGPWFLSKAVVVAAEKPLQQ